MKTPEQILIEVANEHSYNDWGELMYDTHESSQIEYTKEAMEIYANQQNTALQTELAQVRKEREWVSVSKAKPEILDGSESESVLACTKLPTGPKGEHEFFILKEYLKYTKKGWIWRGDGSIVENQITHWMPLPAAPDNLK